MPLFARFTTNLRWLIISTVIAMTTSASLSALAFEELTEAQQWIYTHGHLSNTESGQSLDYGYSGTDNNESAVEDTAKLSITASHDDGKRDVEVDFLSGERHIPLPAFESFRGNPMIIAMLEHIAQSMSAQTGGGALYFRNRIRDALASEDVELVESVAVYRSEEHDAITMTFYPFMNDEYLGEKPVLRGTKFSIQISDDIPGGLFKVEVSARDGDTGFERSLSLQ